MLIGLAHGGSLRFCPDSDPRQREEFPGTPSEALAFFAGLFDVLQIAVSQAHTWEPFQAPIVHLKLAGNDVPAAWLASYATSIHSTVATFDKGFHVLLPK